MGGANPVRVQSMCNTDTRDVDATARQITELEAAGCEINRVAVPDMAAAKAIGQIKKRIHTPLVADIHFDYKLALEAVKQGADKIRINPGNIGGEGNVREVVKACADKNIPIRIGVNAGSLKNVRRVEGGKATPLAWAKLMVEEAAENINILERLNFKQVFVSLKADDVERTVLANELFSKEFDIPLHLGVTEAGSYLSGTVKSAIGLSSLLKQGIGATVRVSLTEAPVMQVRCAYEILKALNLRKYGPDIISCPTCGRCRVEIAATVRELEAIIYSDADLLKKATGLKIAVMGCAVNGPGEAKEADFGIAGGEGEGILFERGVVVKKIPQQEWVPVIIKKIKEYK